ncbi:MAG: hypothetical protein H6721_32420 [Sandaracinus sp.]|nr:hypothetical protein [Sandaracinus sp.]
MTYVAAGYLVSIPVPRGSYSNATLVADEIWSASDCQVPRFGCWTLAWVDADRTTPASALGVTDVDALVAWCTAAFDAERMGWPDLFFTLEAAREARDRFAPSAQLFGLALRSDYADELLDDADDDSNVGVVLALRRAEPLAHGGTPRGFDVLCWDGYGGFHSYLCNSLETELATLGLRSGALGLFANEDDANRAAAHVGLETTAAEPGLWLPWKVVEYA